MRRCTIVPHRSTALRPAVVTAAAIIAGVALPAVAGCRPAATSTAVPTSDASAVDAVTPWSTSAPTAAGFTAVLTPTETATFTPQATLDPSVPAPVSMTLDEAKAEALSWFDASRSPRVEWAGYVAREVIGAGLEDGRIYDTIAHAFRPIDRLSPVGIVVVASTFGLSMPLDAADGGRHSPCGHEGCGGGESVREREVVLFDALSGERFATTPDEPWSYQPDLEVIQRASAPWTTPVSRPPSATPTATWASGSPPMPAATRFPTPDAPPLWPDNVPAPMRRALAAYPQLPGSRWRWRVTARYAGVWWSAWSLEEVVEEGWIVAEDRIVVRAQRSSGHRSGRSIGEDGEEEISTIWRTIHADGVVESTAYMGGIGPNVMSAGCCPGNDIAVLLDPLADPTRTPSMGPDILEAVHRALTTAAGRFDDCATYYFIWGNGHGTHRAVCKGVGYVRSEFVASTAAGEAIEAMDLVDYDVVLPR